MTDLSHWDFAEHFSAYDVAALILGLEPRESDGEQIRVRVVSDRMEMHYTHALKRYYHEAFNIQMENYLDVESSRRFELESVEMNELQRHCDFDKEDSPFSTWLSGKQSQFEEQIFSRHAVAQWLDVIGAESIYQFSLDHEVNRRWPWGDHHTVMLGHLAAAAHRHWVNYDPADATTASTNATVIKWLQTERKVSRKMAEAIATMLRPDGLPTGPRK